MIVHFIGSRSHIREEVEHYRTIVEAIKDSGYELTYDWVNETYSSLLDAPAGTTRTDWEKIDERFETAMQQADVVIVDCTLRGFFVGYRTAQAIAQKKPLLLLTRDTTAKAVAGINTPTGYIRSTAYDKDNLRSIIQNFLEENTIDTKDLRFNFFLDRRTYNYLRWMSSKTGRTKAEIVRSLLQREMDNDD
jgi:hypothetical protein